MMINRMFNYFRKAKLNYIYAYQSEGLNGVYNRVLNFFKRRLLGNREDPTAIYSKWCKNHTLSESELNFQRTDNKYKIKFLFILNKNLKNYFEIRKSLLEQTFIEFEILDVNSINEFNMLEGKIFDFVIYINNEFLCTQNFLYNIAGYLANNQVSILYLDHDHISENQRHSPIFKPDFSVEMFLSIDYILSPVIVDYKLFITSFDKIIFDNLFHYEIILRNLKNNLEIHHLSEILYHKISEKIFHDAYPNFISELPNINIQREEIIKEFLIENEKMAVIEEGLLPFTLRIKYELESIPLVSIIIPTRNRMDLVMTCINSILYKSTYTNYEIILIDNNSDDPKSIEYFDSLKNNPKIKLYKYNYPFNFSSMNNFAVNVSSGEQIIFLNNDTEIISKNWIESMLEYSQKGNVGCVGAKLLYPNTNIQHAGVIIGLGNLAGHSHRFVKYTDLGYLASPWIVREYSAVTAACIMIKKELFLKIGGFNEEYLPVAYNDIDLCLKCREIGFENIYTPYAQLFHYESVSRKIDDTPEKIARSNMETKYFSTKWKKYIDYDKYYSKYLTKEYEDYRL